MFISLMIIAKKGRMPFGTAKDLEATSRCSLQGAPSDLKVGVLNR